MPETAPYGSWKSPITSDLTAGSSISFTDLKLDGRDLYWVETRPDEGGRFTVVCRHADGSIIECTPPEFSVRTSVHEYGGGAFTVGGGWIYFSNFNDQRIYRQRLDRAPQALTPGDGYRYADAIIDDKRDRLICVREDHTGAGEPVNTIVAVDLHGRDNGRILAGGHDFYSTPRLCPDGGQLAYLTWDHPNMPWDGCELHLAAVAQDGSLRGDRLIIGGPSEAIFQPEWSPDGILHFVAEHTGWWNLYRWQDGAVAALCPMPAEFGRAMWLFGYSTYGFASKDRIICCYTDQGTDRLAWLNSADGTLEDRPSPYTEIDFLQCGSGCAAFVGGSPLLPSTVALLDFEGNKLLPIRRALENTVDAGYISVPQDITFPSTGGTAHAIFYAPRNSEFMAAATERPPLIVTGHGGPTSAASTSLRYAVQYWTSRGFAVADVNYGGSTGYGRDYRKRLNGQWGVLDVEDLCNAALFLAEHGLVDRQRMIIKGRSAGGFTTFAALVFRSEIFSAGVSHCGVADLETFVKDTHKFESHYLDTLVGPYPEHKDLYLTRSPIHYTDALKCPLILFQGSEDKVVLPAQSELMYEAVRRKGLPAAYVVLPGEGHVFRKAETWKRLHEGELYFFSRIFGLEISEEIEPVQIANLPEPS
jgi:dienelactone hydrolase